MKFTLEAFDFSGLTENSILMVEVSHQSADNFQRINRTMKALFDSGKIPKGVLCLINSKAAPINLREIPEKVMNENGWIKLKVQLGNANPALPEVLTQQTESVDRPA